MSQTTIIYGVISKARGAKPIRMDAGTDALMMMDYEHQEIHAGDHYMVSGFETESSGGTITFGVTCPSGAKHLHMTIDVKGVTQTSLEIREDATVSAGSAVTPVNNNRCASGASSIATIVKDPTINGSGSQIFAMSAGREVSGFLSADLSGKHDRDREIIFKAGATTLVRIESYGNSNVISYILEWYEHTDRNWLETSSP